MTMLDTGAMDLPEIPGKRYFAIGEVSKLCEIKPHVLRYWEQEFEQLQPVKRRGNRRYYQRHEVKLVRVIRQLLYIDGFTISGARTRLEEMAADAEANKLDRKSNQGSMLIETQKLVKELAEVISILR